MDEIALRIALRDTPGLRRREAWRLLEVFGQPAAIFGRGPRELVGHCSREAARALARGPGLRAARQHLARVRDLGLDVLAPEDPGFPPLLTQIPDPPLVLYRRGSLREWVPSLSVVGARRCTARARETARALAAEVAAAGVIVVSGLAYGIDAAAHEGALDAGGRTVAVLASGLDRPGPRGNRRLAARILEAGGAWISEYPPGEPSHPYRFPERNRLISGLSAQSLIVEARERSGSLWTARHALDQGREVMAVPGPVDTDRCRGSNGLIRDGATVILDAAQLLRRVLPGHDTPARAAPAPSGVAPPEAERVLRRLAEGPADSEALARELGLAPARLAVVLLELELEGRVSRAGARVALRA